MQRHARKSLPLAHPPTKKLYSPANSPASARSSKERYTRAITNAPRRAPDEGAPRPRAGILLGANDDSAAVPSRAALGARARAAMQFNYAD